MLKAIRINKMTHGKEHVEENVTQDRVEKILTFIRRIKITMTLKRSDQ